MRIAIDARELEGKPTGVGRYLANLLRFWLSHAGSDTFLLFHRRDLPRRDWMESDRLSLQPLDRGVLPHDSWWQQLPLPRALRAARPDVLFAPADSMPLLWRGATVVTFHDLSYEAHPEWFGTTEGLRRRAQARLASRRAAAIIAISHFTRRELERRYGVAPQKIRVVPHGIDESLLAAPFTPEEELRSRLEMTRPFALVVGSLFERRFPLAIIRSFRHLDDLGLGLVLAGDDRRMSRGDLRREIAQLGLEDRVKWLEYCPQRDLCGLYRSAEMLIALSLYEGFSLPPLEAMLFDLPAIVSARGAQLEVYGEAARTVERETEEQIGGAVRELATDAEMRRRLIAAGRKLVSRLTLRESATTTLELIRETAEAAGG